MRKPIQIVLWGEPLGKGRPRFVRATGHAYTPAITREYENALGLAAREAMNGWPPLDGPVSAVVVAAFPIPESWSRRKRQEALVGKLWPTVKPDADNILKMLDALNAVVWLDDKQVVDCRVTKCYSDRPFLRVDVGEVA